MDAFKDYYKILEISPFSSLEEIRKSYKNQMKIWHPDINKSYEAHDKSIEIQEAYQILHTVEKRALYDNFYFNYYLKKQKTNFEPTYSDLRDLNEVILEAQNQAKIFVSKGFKHFIKLANQGVSFVNYIFFLFSVFFMSSLGISFGIGLSYSPLKALITNSEKLTVPILVFCVVFISLGLFIIYRTIKFAIYKLRFGPDSK